MAVLYQGALGASPPYTAYDTPAGLPWQLSATSGGDTLTNILSGATLGFDAQGRYVASRDSYGNRVTLSYCSTASTAPVSATNGGGRVLAAGAGTGGGTGAAQGLLSDAHSPRWQSSGGTGPQGQGQHVSDGYNGSGQLITRTHGAGSSDAVTSTFGYSGTQLVTITTPSGHSWSLGYDSAGRVNAVLSPVSGTVGQTGYTPADATVVVYDDNNTYSQYGLRAAQIEQLIQAIIQGTGRIG